MPRWIAISKQQHAGAHFYPREGYHHAVEHLVAPVLLAELPKLVPQFLLGFTSQDEGFMAVALLGLHQDHNLYVHPDGRWLGSYVPASLRGYPFSFLPDEQGKRVLCIDAERLTDDAQAGSALLDEDGQPTEAVVKHLEFQQHCEADRQRTQRAVDALQQAGVIQPWPLEVTLADAQSPKKLAGLYRIDEKALNTLKPETYATLQGAAMALAHAQLFSVNQLSQLTDRAKFHAQHSPEEVPENLDNIFGEEDDLTFDFD